MTSVESLRKGFWFEEHYVAKNVALSGIPTPRGGRWQAQSVANVLRYLGMATVA
jgi:hypothetical protein